MAIFRGSDELSNYQRGPTIQFLVIYPYPWKLNESCTKNVQKWIIPYIVGFKLSGMLHAAGSCTYILAFFESILEKQNKTMEQLLAWNHSRWLASTLPLSLSWYIMIIIVVMVVVVVRINYFLRVIPHPETLVWHSFWHSPFLEVLYKAYLFHRQKCSK